MESPHFFVDRSLGRIEVPRLLREDGWELTTLAEHYGEKTGQGVDDVDWLTVAGEHGWPVLMKDTRIRRTTSERDALVKAGVRAFCISSGNLTSAVMAEYFIKHRAAIWRAASSNSPGIWIVSKTAVRPTEL